MIEIDRLKIVVITDNYYDALAPDPQDGVRYRTAPGSSIHAEHGLSFYVETEVNRTKTGFMLDYGLDPEGVINNLTLLNIDFSKVAAFGLSHGHFDHWSGLVPVLKRNEAGIAKGTPLYIGAEAFAHRLALPQEGGGPRDLGRLDKGRIEQLDLVEIVEVDRPIEVIPGAYLSGRIERTCEYEQDSPILLIERNGKIEVDNFHGEQALFFNVKGKGLVVLSGCAHVGIVNTVRHGRQLCGTEKVHTIMGGFHLVNAQQERVQKTVEAFKEIRPDHVIPAHCTGFQAIASFAREMPDQFRLNTAGTTYTF